MFFFNARFFAVFLLLFVTEVAIALWAHHGFLRAFVGDVLVIPLLFWLLRALVQIPSRLAAALVLAFACIIEILQAWGLVDLLGLHGPSLLHRVLRIALGATFDWLDFVAYFIGFCVCIATSGCKLHLHQPQRAAWP